MPKAYNYGRLRVRFPDAESMREARVILSYEGALRSRSMGQVASELVLEAADIDSYPEEVREHIAQLEEESRQAAARKVISPDA